MLAPTVHGDLEVGTAEEWIEGARLNPGGSLLGVPPSEAVELVGLPCSQPSFELIREPMGIRRHVENFMGHDPSHLMMPVPVPGRPRKNRDDDLGPEHANHPGHVP